MRVLNFYHIGKVIPENAIYIGRANRQFNLAQSKFANPFPITQTCSRPESVDKYRFWLYDQLKKGVITKQDILNLQGNDLCCYCAPLPCHGDILVKAVNFLVSNPNF
jgi:hypothetical protein